MNEDLFNAAMIAENPEEGFICMGHRLHAVEPHIAEMKKEESDPKVCLPLMRQALTALVDYATGKVPDALVDEKSVSLKANERAQLIDKIVHIYTHLSHHDRLALSSLIHHKQGVK